MFQKIPPKLHDKTVQSNILWLNLNKIGAISILQSAHKKVTPHFTFQNIFPVCSSFVLVIASDMHLEPESEKRAKSVYFHTTKNIQIQSTLFRYFQTNSYKLTSDLFIVV